EGESREARPAARVPVSVDAQLQLPLGDGDQSLLIETNEVEGEPRVFRIERGLQQLLASLAKQGDGDKDVVKGGVEQKRRHHRVVVAHEMVLVLVDSDEEAAHVVEIADIVLAQVVLELHRVRLHRVALDQLEGPPHRKGDLVDARTIKGIQESGDAAGFLDPLYSPGIDQ